MPPIIDWYILSTLDTLRVYKEGEGEGECQTAYIMLCVTAVCIQLMTFVMIFIFGGNKRYSPGQPRVHAQVYHISASACA